MRHHLVILHQPYIDRILAGKKRIECRLSTVRKAPFEAVDSGDLLWIKPPSRPVIAVARAGACEFHEIAGAVTLHRVLRGKRRQIAAAADFFREAARRARYLSLISLESIVLLDSLPVKKRDQRAWIVLDRAPRPGMKVGFSSANSIRVPSGSRRRSSTRSRPRSPG